MNLTLPLPRPLPALSQLYFDRWLLGLIATLLTIGLVMIASSSMSYAEVKFHDPFFFIRRHIPYLMLGIIGGALAFAVPSAIWQRYYRVWVVVAVLLLLVVLIPGLGRRFNGSQRWLGMGGFTFQVSEVAKIAAVFFMAAFLDNYRDAMRSNFKVFLVPVGVMALFAGLLVMEPDFGSTVVLVGTMLTLLFLGGARLDHYLGVLLAGGSILALVASQKEYLVNRYTAYLDPWEHQFDSGYQLTQSLIAFGRGEWFGVGLGQSIQKLLFLPEAHTDFVFAIYAEEFGFVGVLLLIGLFVAFVGRLLWLARRAIQQHNCFAAYSLLGFALLMAGQSFINLGVNAGLLPTKGLTLPLISYGGSSLLITLMMLGIALRMTHDHRLALPDSAKRSRHDKR